MKLVLFFFLFFLVFPLPVFAQIDVNPTNFPNPNSFTGHCLVTLELLSGDDIYTCNYGTTYMYANGSLTNPNTYLYNQCWAQLINANHYNTGLMLKKTFTTSWIPYPDYNIPCKLKTAVDPPQVCGGIINVGHLVKYAFQNKFPLDLFTGFDVSINAIPCPSFTIRGQIFELCYLNKLVASLKYVLLVIFIISSVIAL